MKALRGCLMTPLPIHLAPLGGSRYDHITWYPPKVVRCHHKHLDGLWEKSITRAEKHTSFWPTKTCIIWKIYWKTHTVPVELMKQDLSMFIMQIYAIHLWSIFHFPLLAIRVYPKIMFAKRGFPSHHNKIPQGNSCLPRHKLSTSTPSLATWGLGQQWLLTWATNGQQPAATKGNVEQKPWHDIPVKSWLVHDGILIILAKWNNISPT